MKFRSLEKLRYAWQTLSAHPRRIGRTVVGLLLGGFVLFLLFGSVDTDRVIANITSASKPLLVLSVAVYLLSWPLRGARFGAVLGALDTSFPTSFLTRTVFVSQMVNLFLPARIGDGVRAYIVRDEKTSYPMLFTSLFLERLFDLVAMMVIISLSSASLFYGGAGQRVGGAFREVNFVRNLVILFVLATVLFGVLYATLYTYRQYGRAELDAAGSVRGRVFGFLHRFGDLLLRCRTSVRKIADEPGAVLKLGLYSLAIWALDIGTALLILSSFGVTMSSTIIVGGFLAVSVGNLSKVVPLTPGGWGVYEVAFSVVLSAVAGVATPLAVGAAFLDHILKYSLTVVGGIYSISTIQRPILDQLQ
jgi:uncharacterized protein (TIRG00374 family)